MTRRPLRIAAWLLLAAIVFVTVSPIGLRPHDVMPVNADRALAFGLLAALFVTAYPRQWALVGLAVIAVALGIEGLQLLSPSRHARLDDALVKAFGAFLGVVVGRIALTLSMRLRQLPATVD